VWPDQFFPQLFFLSTMSTLQDGCPFNQGQEGGQAQQALSQQELDAQRANTLQQVYAPYQQAGFLSDIYKGAPSSQMATTAVSAPTPSPFMQAVGTGIGATAAAAAAKSAKLF
jgi:hypothetical protein